MTDAPERVYCNCKRMGTAGTCPVHLWSGTTSDDVRQAALAVRTEAAAKLLETIARRLAESTPPEVAGAINARQYAKAIRSLSTSAEQAARAAIVNEGFELAHELARCGHARANYRDPKYKPDDTECDSSKCEFCEYVKKRDAEQKEHDRQVRLEALREVAKFAKSKCGMKGRCDQDQRDPVKCGFCDLAEEILELDKPSTAEGK